MRRIKIKSDGTPQGTKVYDLESGVPLEGVINVCWWIEVDDVGKAVVTFDKVAIEAVGVSPA